MRQLNRRGMVYVVALGTITFLLITGASMLMRSLSQRQLTERSGNQYAALHLGDAAVDQALHNLRTGNTATITTTPLPTGSYWAELAALNATTYRVTAHGLSGSEQRDIEAVVRSTPKSIFQFALFGSQTVEVGGSAITDSYDSRLGSYASQTPGDNGDVGTNSTQPGGVEVSGGIAINGQIVVGPGVEDPESVVEGIASVVITGDPKVLSASEAFPMPAVVIPSGLSCSDLTVGSNKTTTLSSAVGTYCFRNVTINGGGTLTANGPVKIYMTGELKAVGNGTVVGVASNPLAMRFLMASTAGATLEGTITGSTRFYGALYGPQASIKVQGHAEVFGSIIAQSVHLWGSAEIHYDEGVTDLTDVTNGFTTTLLSWREL